MAVERGSGKEEAAAPITGVAVPVLRHANARFMLVEGEGRTVMRRITSPALVTPNGPFRHRIVVA